MLGGSGKDTQSLGTLQKTRGRRRFQNLRNLALLLGEPWTIRDGRQQGVVPADLRALKAFAFSSGYVFARRIKASEWIALELVLLRCLSLLFFLCLFGERKGKVRQCSQKGPVFRD